MATQTITLDGKKYVVIPREEYERLAQAAELPSLPEPDENGLYPAAAYARASIARSIVRDRQKLGLSQAELARHAGLRVETLNRIEKGRHTPSVASVDKIDRALKRAEKETGRRAAKRSGRNGGGKKGR